MLPVSQAWIGGPRVASDALFASGKLDVEVISWLQNCQKKPKGSPLQGCSITLHWCQVVSLVYFEMEIRVCQIWGWR